MKHIIFIGSHLGYPMDLTPLGGGAMVGLQLARRWASRSDFTLSVLGSGPLPPAPGMDYRQLPTRSVNGGADGGLVNLSEFGYARFCREFEESATQYLAAHAATGPRRDTCVVLNDISEAPDMARAAAMGFPLLSVWHVDVVDFFNKMYFHNILSPDRLTRAFDRLDGWGLGALIPDLLRLVFGKQRQAVAFSSRLVLPSKGMADTLLRCYRHLGPSARAVGRGRTPPVPLKERLMVVPWGGWPHDPPETAVAERAARLKALYRIGPETKVLMTLSRISPEKGLLLLVDALKRLEGRRDRPARDLCLFLCGEPAFMRGRSHDRRLRRAVERLESYRVVFPGYLSPEEKQAHFRLAHLFVSPSIHESYGLSIVEALQAGLPVLASDHSGVEEILTPAFGRVVPYGGRAGGLLGSTLGRGRLSARLAAALDGMLRDPAGLAAMGRAAREAASRMSFAGAADRVAGAALELANGEGKAGGRAERGRP